MPRFLALRSWTSHSNYLVSWHIFIFLPALRLLPHLFYLLAASVSFFPLLDFFHIFVLFFVFFLPFQLATNKRRSQWKAWLGVIMSANLLGHLEKYEKSTAAATPYGHSLFSFCHLARNFNIEPRKKNERTRKGKNKIVAYYGI